MAIKVNTEKFIQKCKDLELDKRFSFERVIYKSAKEKIIIICKSHGEFEKTPCNFLHRSNCPKCSSELRRISQAETTENFLTKCINLNLQENFSFEKVNYINNRTNIIITCKIHGDFSRNPDTFLRTKSCPKCIKKFSGEEIISQYLESSKINFIKQYKFKNCKGLRNKLPFDFWLPDFNICIEYDGRQHFDKSSKFYSEELIKCDHIKNEYCSKNNINLIRISFLDKMNIQEILNCKLHTIYNKL